MNNLSVTPRGPWADVRSCMSQVRSITIIVGGQVYTDFSLTESDGQVTLIVSEPETFEPTPWDAEHETSAPHTLEAEAEMSQPKRRGRPPKNAHLEGDDAK